MNPQPAVEIENLSFRRGGEPVLTGVNLTVPSGEFLGIVGPNGGGKSTLLQLMAGLLAPCEGRVRLFGQPPGQNGRLIGYVPQETGVNPGFPIRALDVVRMGLLGGLAKLSGKEERARAEAMLDRLGAAVLSRRRFGELSGGERQRVLIARALMGEVRLLLLDEPTASIDAKGQQEIYRLLQSLQPEVTVVMVSHDIAQLIGYASSVASINRRLLHCDRLPKACGHEGHVCEVELLEAFLTRRQDV
ncbi:MAG: metal ABC transporter ATP-binding protein [Campylobacterales bacterium]